MDNSISELDSVALLADLPDEGLKKGQSGTVVFVHREGEAFEVEFMLTPRKSIVATVQPTHLLKLHGLRSVPASGS
jgi:hypothetical protein